MAEPAPIAAPTTLLDLPPIVILNILEAFATSPTDILCFGRTCKAAHVIANEDTLWRRFCNDLPEFSDAAAWNAASFQHLWVGLLLPFKHLLGKLWHSNSWPSGQLLHVDVQAPRLIGRSLYYKCLNGPPWCHDVFVVQLQQATPPLAKASVQCWRDRHSADTFESPARLQDVQGGGFVLCCAGHCDSVATESTNRRLRCQPYPVASCIRPHEQQQQQHRQTLLQHSSRSFQCNSSRSSESSSTEQPLLSMAQPCRALSAAGDVGQPPQLPLPDMTAMPHTDFINYISLADLQPTFRPPLFRALKLNTWSPSSAMADRTCLAARSSSSSSRDNTGHTGSSDSTIPFAASHLLGLWRGTYGSHGAEVVQLQLLQAPLDFKLCDDGHTPAADALAALSADNQFAGQSGVLLQGLAGLDAHQEDGRRGLGQRPAAAATGLEAEQHPQQLALHAEVQMPATAEAAAAGTEALAQAHTGQLGGAQQPAVGPLLLVATKLTGDQNVPVGHVTFAVEVSSGCGVGPAGPLVLPAGYDSDVALAGAGVRRLVVKERYRGRSQIAFTSFDSPRVIAAELITFEDLDCFGLLWKHPVMSFSLFSRASSLPGVLSS